MRGQWVVIPSSLSDSDLTPRRGAMLDEFKKFVMRGNLLELAVAFIMGVAFATVVTAFTNIVLSFIAAIFGADVSFNHLTFTLNDTPIPYGAFLTAVVSFLIVAWVLFFLVQA